MNSDGFLRTKLGDGIRLWVRPDKRFKSVWIRAFLQRPLDGDTTLAALLPSVLRRGCRGYESMAKVSAHLEDLYGASYGAEVQKMGDRHLLSFHLEVVNDRFLPGGAKTLDKAIRFLSTVMTKPALKAGTFRKDYVEGEKENQKRAIEGLLNDRATYAYERCLREMCRGEAYARYELGELEDLPGITPKVLTEFHKRMFSEASIDFFVAGDVSPAAMTKLFKSAFAPGKRKVLPLPDVVLKPAPRQPRELVEKMDVEQAHLVMGARTGTTWSSPDIFALSFANAVLGGFPHSKLFRNVRERDGLAYAAGSSLDPAKGLLFITAGIDFANYRKAVDTIREQIDAICQGDVSAEEMDKTRASLLNRTRSREDNLPALISVAHELDACGRMYSTKEFMERYQAVTKEDVTKAAGKIALDTIFFLTKND